MGDYPGNRLAVSFYGLVMCLMALGFVALRWHMHRHPDLIQQDVDRGAFRSGYALLDLLLGPVAYASAAILAWLSTPAAFICFAAIAASFVRPREPGPRRAAGA